MDNYVPNKYLCNLYEKLQRLLNRFEIALYGEMYAQLDILYTEGRFDEASKLISSIETNSITVRMAIDLRLKQFDYKEE